MGRHREFDVEEALDAALSVFWQKGYEGASFEDLTNATGVARPGLYAAFGNKESLFLRALDRYDAKYMRFMSESLNEQNSRDVVRHILEESIKVLTFSPSTRGCLGVNGALACSDDGEPIRKELIKRRNANEAALRARLERAKQEGDLPRAADCGMLAGYVMAVNQGLCVQAKAGAPKAKLASIVEHVLTTWPSSQRSRERK